LPPPPPPPPGPGTFAHTSCDGSNGFSSIGTGAGTGRSVRPQNSRMKSTCVPTEVPSAPPKRLLRSPKSGSVGRRVVQVEAACSRSR
jgi:hypothetical protein